MKGQVRVRRRQLLALVPLVLVAAAVPAVGTKATPYPATLTVEPRGGHFASDFPRIAVVLDVRGEASAPARIAIEAPPQFFLEPQRDEGAPVGDAEVYLRNGAGELVRYAGPISATSAAAAPRGCGPAEPAAMWLIRATNGRRKLELPVVIGSERGTQLHLCPDSGRRVGAVALSLTDVTPPAATGTYVWRAYVTPRSGREQTFELRAVVPVPQVLTIGGTYRAKTRRAVLEGTLLVRGKPRPGATIDIVRLDRRAYPIAFNDSWDTVVLTTRRGSYRVALPLVRTQGFVASTRPTLHRCQGPSTAPAGCRTASIAGAESDPVTVSVP